jgi:hypothetical protein
VILACNYSFSGGRDQEDCGSRPASANCSLTPYLEKNHQKKKKKKKRAAEWLKKKRVRMARIFACCLSGI